MSLAAQMPRSDPTSSIDAVEADIRVTAPQGPLSSPERLLAALRAEVLPVLSSVLEAPPFSTSQITLDALEIDLGTWPDDPFWPDVRRHFAQELRAALTPYLQTPEPSSTPARQHDLPKPAHGFLAALAPLPAVDQLATVLYKAAQNGSDGRGHSGLSGGAPESNPPTTGSSERTGVYAAALLAALKAAPAQSGILDKTLAETGSTNARTLQDLVVQLGKTPDALDQLVAQLPAGDLRAALIVHQAFAPLQTATATAQWAGMLALLGDRKLDRRGLSTGTARRAITRLTPPLQDAVNALLAMPPDQPELPRPSNKEHQARSDGSRTARSANPATAAQAPTPAAALRHISGLPALQQARALLHHIARFPDHLSAMQSKDLAQLRLLCDPALQSILETPFGAPSRTAALTDLQIQVQTHASPRPQTSLQWINAAHHLAPDLLQGMTGKTPRPPEAGLPSTKPDDADATTPTGRDAVESRLRDALGRKPETAPQAAYISARIAALWQLVNSQVIEGSGPKDAPTQSHQAQEPKTSPRRQTAKSDPAIPFAEQDTNRPEGIGQELGEQPMRELRVAFDIQAPVHQTLPELLAHSPDRFFEVLSTVPPAMARTALQAVSESWATLLRHPSGTVARLRLLWAGHKPALQAAIRTFSRAELHALANRLLPAGAFLLRDRLKEFSDAPDTTSAKMQNAVETLLSAEVLDFDVLGAPAPPATPIDALLDLIELDTASLGAWELTTDAAAARPVQMLLASAVPIAAQVLLDHIWAAWPNSTPATNLTAPADPGSQANHWPLWHAVLQDVLQADVRDTASEPPYDAVARALARLEPEEEALTTALRVVSARLALPDPGRDNDVRRAARGIVEDLLASRGGKATPNASREIHPETPFWPTQAAGLPLLKPHFELLFTRLGVQPVKNRLTGKDLSRALAILDAVADTGPGFDPLKKVLLGVAQDTLPPEPVELETDALALIDGLLRAVIAQWGKLGSTTPDALRETFIQRTGAFEIDDEGIHLRVAPGPFDMLMDAVPWTFTPVKLPWMALPLHVNWRETDD